MSVINKMLRDLEQRQHSSTAASPAILRRADNSRWLFALSIVCLVLVAALGALWYQQQASGAVSVGQSAPLPEQASADPVEQHEVLTEVVDIDAQTAAVSALPPRPAPVIALTEPALHAEPVATDTASASSERAVGQADVATASAQPVAVVASLAEPVVQNHRAGQLHISSEQLSPQQQAQRLQQKALTAEHSGQLPQALQLWQQYQQNKPDDAQGYLAQARLLQALGQAPQAETVLQQALQHGIVDVNIQLLLAQRAAQQQQWQQANAYLPDHFTLALYPDYYGLKATVQQQLGDHVAAGQWFSQLLIIQPQQAKWWLGAAISFDALAQKQQAHRHYQQALQWGGSLSDASRNYIQQRLIATE